MLCEQLEGSLGPDDPAWADHVAGCPEHLRPQLIALLTEFRSSVFAEAEFPAFPPERAVEFDIPLLPDSDIPFARGQRLSFVQIEALKGMIRELLQGGLIRPSKSPFSAPLLMVTKPDGSWRLVVDYRKLNSLTIKDKYPLPNPQALFNQMQGSTVFSVLDLQWGYHQVLVKESDAHKTAFSTPLGSFEWMVMRH